MRGQLDALRFAAGERGGRLAEAQIAQADFVEHGEFFEQAGLAGKEAQRLLHRHLQHLVDVLALVLDFENPGLVAGAVAVFAGQLDVGQELHFDGHGAVAFAGVAAAAGHVEGEMSGRERKALGLGLGGEELADQIEALDIGDGIGARRAADGGLVDQHNVVEALDAGERCE